MITFSSRAGLVLAVSFAFVISLSAQDGTANPRNPAPAPVGHGHMIPSSEVDLSAIELPPLPDGVKELNFRDFYKMPVGDYGLEMTEKLRALDGQRVRIIGFMVHEDLSRCNSCTVAKTVGGRPVPAWMEATVPGRMMFTSRPCAVSFSHYGLSDDLPPQTLFVTVPEKVGQLVPYTPGPMLLTGILSVGSKKEMDGRVSYVRLELDPPTEAAPIVSNDSVSTVPVSR